MRLLLAIGKFFTPKVWTVVSETEHNVSMYYAGAWRRTNATAIITTYENQFGDRYTSTRHSCLSDVTTVYMP